MSDEQVLAPRSDGRLVPVDPADRPLLAADSWLVRDGRVRGIHRHRRRFFDACADAAGLPLERLFPFWFAALDEIPRTGDWFPRVELWAGPEPRFQIRIRTAPARTTEVRVWVCDRPDPRTSPRRKGPDLPLLGGLRERAAAQGGQEALLTDRRGIVLEAASSSILWWEGDLLCSPSPALPALAGVTAGLVRDRAEELGMRVAYRQVRPADLDGREVWLVNALHGIRPVVGWPGSALVAGPGARAVEWVNWLAGLDLPVPPSPALRSGQVEVPAGR